jgi:hypothetical protein
MTDQGASPPKDKPALAWLRSPLKVGGTLGVAAATAFVVYLVNYSSPGVVRSLSPSPDLRVYAAIDNSMYSAGWTKAFQSAPSSQPSGSPQCPLKWAIVEGGVDVRTTTIKMVVENAQDANLTITGIRPIILKQSPPISEVAVECPSAGANESTMLMLDLDAPHSLARRVRFGGFIDSVPYFKTHSVSLTPGEQHVFEIRGVAKRGYYIWTIAIDTVSRGEKGTLKLGRSFRTTGYPKEYETYFQWAWWEKRRHLITFPGYCPTSSSLPHECVP